jgi:hypothetical protein
LGFSYDYACFLQNLVAIPPCYLISNYRIVYHPTQITLHMSTDKTLIHTTCFLHRLFGLHNLQNIYARFQASGISLGAQRQLITNVSVQPIGQDGTEASIRNCRYNILDEHRPHCNVSSSFTCAEFMPTPKTYKCPRKWPNGKFIC